MLKTLHYLIPGYKEVTSEMTKKISMVLIIHSAGKCYVHSEQRKDTGCYVSQLLDKLNVFIH